MTEEQKTFFEKLDRLGNGERAALRREAGVMLQDAAGSALTAFYRCLPVSVGTAQEAKWFAVACLRCLWDAGEQDSRPLEQIISRMMRGGDLSASTEHRVELLIDTRWDQDGYMLGKLARLIKLVRQKSDRAEIDFPVLLEDLLFWNGERQTVQRKWARAIFGNQNYEEARE